LALERAVPPSVSRLSFSTLKICLEKRPTGILAVLALYSRQGKGKALLSAGSTSAEVTVIGRVTRVDWTSLMTFKALKYSMSFFRPFLSR
jgi:hypothetical protein